MEKVTVTENPYYDILLDNATATNVQSADDLGFEVVAATENPYYL